MSKLERKAGPARITAHDIAYIEMELQVGEIIWSPVVLRRLLDEVRALQEVEKAAREDLRARDGYASAGFVKGFDSGRARNRRVLAYRATEALREALAKLPEVSA